MLDLPTMAEPQGSSFVAADEVGYHGLADCGMAVLFGTHGLKSHGLVEDSKTVAPQIDKPICPGLIADPD